MIRTDFLSHSGRTWGVADPPCTEAPEVQGNVAVRTGLFSQHLGTWLDSAFPGRWFLDTELIILIKALQCSHCETETGLSSVKVWLKGIKLERAFLR